MAESRTYTRETANELLPEVRARMSQLQEALATMQQHQESMSKASKGNGGNPRGGEWKQASDLLAEHLGWFESGGIIVRDIAQGLIDFPAVRDGEDVLLCWKTGEDSVDFWHYPDTGFAGRQPL